MSYLDIACVVILVLALLHGLLKGLFRPLITWAFIIAGVAVGFGRPGVAASFAPSPGWRPLMGLVVVVVFAVVGFLVAHLVAPRIYGLIPGMGVLDRLGGAVLSVVLALVMIFILLNGLVTLDRATAPIDGSAPVSVAVSGCSPTPGCRPMTAASASGRPPWPADETLRACSDRPSQLAGQVCPLPRKGRLSPILKMTGATLLRTIWMWTLRSTPRTVLS